MHFNLASRLCFLLAFVSCATCQRAGSWGPPQNNYKTTNWNSASSFSNNGPSSFGSWGSNNAPSSSWGSGSYPQPSVSNLFGSESRVPSSGLGNSGNSNRENNYESSSWNSNKPASKVPEKQNSNNFNKKKDEQKLASITNWNSGSSKSNSNDNFNSGNNFKQTSGQTSRPNSNSGNWNSNSFNANDIFSSSDDEDNNIESWNSAQNSKPSNFNNEKNSVAVNWVPQTSYNKKTENNYNNNRKTSNDKKPSKSSSSSNNKPDEQSSSGSEDKKKSNVDLSILDELDKNDWYFGKESDYPRPPFKTNLNIDVSELWNVQPQKQSQSNQENNNKRRRNRETRHFGHDFGKMECECVSVTQCDEDDMMLSQKDIASYGRPLEEYLCEDLTEVCCIKPYSGASPRFNVDKKRSLECGQRKMGDDFGNFGDDVALPGEFPWSLQLRKSGRESNCSASLIHPQLALTAAHCVDRIDPDNLKLIAGLWSSNDKSSQIRKVARTILHPDFNSENPRNDIALLILENSFKLTDNVNTVCLPVTNDKWDPTECFVAGWKPKEINGEIFQVLGKTTVGFLPQYDCQNMLLLTDMWRNYIMHESFGCGVDKAGKGSCLNNEGGALVCPEKSTGSFVQIGIVSDGVNCDQYGRPGIFTNVLQFLDWINGISFDLGFFDDIDARSLQ